ncbi:hypothetical protein [Metabacillus fastidiosus]|uniref:hypothetical protein n=1 Tax=Metabacillus fastidiosus TaxID=1458 RepID=UPI003D2DD8F8
MAIAAKDLKMSKELVEKLLKVNGQKYNEWLFQQHQNFIENNQDLILQALNAFSQTGKVEEKEEERDIRPSSFLNEKEKFVEKNENVLGNATNDLNLIRN